MKETLCHFPILLTTVLLVACSSPETPGPSFWLIDPQGNIGGITPRSTEEDVIRIFGEKNVETVEIDVGEGEVEEGTRIFPGTNRVLDIEWRGKKSIPYRITVHGDHTAWKTKEGLTIGSTLEEVEAANGGPFLITGLDWDYPARSVSWRDGGLPPELQLEFSPDLTVSSADRSSVQGDGQFPSDHEAVCRLRLTVNRMFVVW